jgi:O-antigen/teichoic acid export membrane protein
MIDASATGLYTVSYKIPTMLTLISGIFIEAWQFSAVKEKRDGLEEHASFFSVTFDNFQAVMFVSGAFLIAFSKIATRIMADPSYFDSWQYIPVLSIATVFSALVTFMGVIYLMEKKSLLSFYTALVGAVLNIVLNLLLIRGPLQANGAAIATFASYFVVFIIRAIQTRRYIKFRINTIALVANTLLLALQTVFILTDFGDVVLMQALCLAAVCAINFAPLFRTAKFLLRSVLRR